MNIRDKYFEKAEGWWQDFDALETVHVTRLVDPAATLAGGGDLILRTIVKDQTTVIEAEEAVFLRGEGMV